MKRHFPAIAFVLLAALGCAAFVRLSRMVPEPRPKPIADAINTNNQRHVGVVVKVDRQHRFPNGAVTEGWLIRGNDGVEVWFSQTNLPHSTLMWRK